MKSYDPILFFFCTCTLSDHYYVLAMLARYMLNVLLVLVLKKNHTSIFLCFPDECLNLCALCNVFSVY